MAAPNVILVLADQHHAGLLGCAGHPQVLTPNFDRFAASGVRFTNAYCQNVICTPSRVSILSGQYCHNHGYYGLSGPAWFELPNLFRHLRAHGYRTAGLGKLHLPDIPRNWVADDLDLFADTYENAEGERGRSAYFEHLERLGLRKLEDSWHNPWHYHERQDSMPSEMPYEQTQEYWCTRRAFEFIDEAPDHPFFIEVAYQKPHHPLLPQRQFWDLYPPDLDLPPTFDREPNGRPPHFMEMWRHLRKRDWALNQPGQDFRDAARRIWRGTLANISQIDDIFGRLLDGLTERGLSNNTIVVYGSDHGCYHTIHGIHEKAPGICSDAVCRVPMIWRLPAMTPAGRISDQLVESVDIAPTFCALCGLPPMDTADGRDITPLLHGGNESLREVAVTENPWSKSLRWKQWRFVHYQREMFEGQDLGELYDIEADPNETQNLYLDPDRRETVRECRRRLLEWLIATTRNRTVHPPPEHRPVPEGCGRGLEIYRTAADGKEATGAGADERMRLDLLKYL